MISISRTKVSYLDHVSKYIIPGFATYRIVVALGFVDFGDLHEAGVSALERIDATFQVLVFLRQLSDVFLVDSTESLTSLLVEVAKSLADVLELRSDIAGDVAGEFLPLIHLVNRMRCRCARERLRKVMERRQGTMEKKVGSSKLACITSLRS